MRVLGLDIGDNTIGVAVSDPLGFTAQGITTVKRTSLEKDLQELSSICAQYGVEKIIAGLPKNMNGCVGPQAEKVLEFVEHLKENLGIPVETWDERFSTLSAQRILIEGDVRRKKRKTVIDKMAAVLILQNYLDSLSSL
jgi:putative Holliday junction resolvase